jgi:hypothetical protein
VIPNPRYFTGGSGKFCLAQRAGWLVSSTCVSAPLTFPTRSARSQQHLQDRPRHRRRVQPDVHRVVHERARAVRDECKFARIRPQVGTNCTANTHGNPRPIPTSSTTSTARKRKSTVGTRSACSRDWTLWF